MFQAISILWKTDTEARTLLGNQSFLWCTEKVTPTWQFQTMTQICGFSFQGCSWLIWIARISLERETQWVKHLSLYTQISFWFQSFKNQTVLCHSCILRVLTLVRTLTGFTPPLPAYLGGGGGGGLLGSFTMPPSTHLKISNCCMSLRQGRSLPFSSWLSKGGEKSDCCLFPEMDLCFSKFLDVYFS